MLFRLLWYTTSLKVLEIHSEKVGYIVPDDPYHFRSGKIRDTVPLVLYSLDFNNCSHLQAITFRGFLIGAFDLITVLKTAKNLRAISFIEGEFKSSIIGGKSYQNLNTTLTYLAIRDSDVNTYFLRADLDSALFAICSRVKIIDIRGCEYNTFYYPNKQYAVAEVKTLYPQADVLTDENEYYEFDLND